jgi:hypothetical protein
MIIANKSTQFLLQMSEKSRCDSWWHTRAIDVMGEDDDTQMKK